MSIIDLLRDTLRKPDGSTVKTVDALAGKEVLALYFSAHWCPPCRGFTPTLSEKYTKLKDAGKEFEMVFVSSDKNKEEYAEYHKEMTFLALPYELRDEKAKLSKKFKVSGIPSLVFIDLKTGKLITDEGREAVSAPDFIETFPYRPVQIDVVATLGSSLRKPDGTTVSTSEAVGSKSVLGLYFSAHWCPPCRGFTPVLSEKYTALKEAGTDFELVFVSSDRDEKAFTEYHNEMSFLALPFELRKEKKTLSNHFKVSGIPALVFYDIKSGELITTEGRGGVASDSFIEDFPYRPKPVNDLKDNASGINECVSLVVLMESVAKAEQTAITEALTAIAEAELAKPEGEQLAEKFFTGCGGGPVDKVRSACGYPASSTEPVMLLLDLADEGAYYHPEASKAATTPENIKAFLQAFKDCTLEKKTFGQ